METTANVISFGTSGHRGIMGQSFTIAHIQAISIGIARYLAHHQLSPRLVIGYDPRDGNSPTMKSGSYTLALVTALQNVGISVLFSDDYVSTPAIAWAVTHFKLSGGIMLTASHNPPMYNGLKFNTANGAPATQKVTDFIQKFANAVIDQPQSPLRGTQKGTVDRVDLNQSFSQYLVRLVANFGQLKSLDLSGIHGLVDVRHGVAGSVWNHIGKSTGLRAELMYDEPRSDFGNRDPNPTATDALTELVSRIQVSSIQFGVSHDPDADRHVIIDDCGDIWRPEEVCALIVDFCMTRCPKLIYGITTTVASSRLIEAVCRHYQLTYNQTRVGFKYVTPFFEQAKLAGQIGFGVESSGGFSMSTHTFEKCGFLPAVLVAFILKVTNVRLSALRTQLIDRFGGFDFHEQTLSFDHATSEMLKQSMMDDAFEQLQAGTIDSINRLDGVRINFDDGSWVLCRFSGTEPVVRVYAESCSPDRTRFIMDTMCRYVTSKSTMGVN